MVFLSIILIVLMCVFGIGAVIIDKEETEWKKRQK